MIISCKQWPETRHENQGLELGTRRQRIETVYCVEKPITDDQRLGNKGATTCDQTRINMQWPGTRIHESRRARDRKPRYRDRSSETRYWKVETTNQRPRTSDQSNQQYISANFTLFQYVFFLPFRWTYYITTLTKELILMS